MTRTTSLMIRTDFSPRSVGFLDERVARGPRRLAAEEALATVTLFPLDATTVLELSGAIHRHLVHVKPLSPLSGTTGLSFMHLTRGGRCQHR